MTISVGLSMLVRYDLQADVARLADDLGYDGLWFPEHLIWPADFGGASPYEDDDHPPVDPRIPTYDALLWMATLAQVTSRIRLGTYVYNLSLRHPFVAARAVQTLDVISGGRVDFGVGAGWSRAEYAAVGVDFASRGRRVDENIAVCRKLWTDDPVSHKGEFYAFDPVHFLPKPPQGRVPILIGGVSNAALSRAARLGDGWIGMRHSPADIAAKRARLGEDVTIVTGAHIRTVEDLRAYEAAGADRVIVVPWRRSTDALTSIRSFAEEILQPARTEGLLTTDPA
ncbi:LLM class F420-dependent oxidoreductase [Actinocorallia sp. A-T 12471]|uniref:LLM class F420-dependent oxidoreductase n=1 Tax=Actinocorallia sp. A-T 12471 TaxID=3089813 RepID=UPI0029D39A2B|nr:LLM class F420-dependent oxidoreductase [Actinocorallia sp. A-T 12471]MDX6741459.1 LLM class F420-dependent oxidoreductase [Actinocorallia sp. A-T 12471]